MVEKYIYLTILALTSKIIFKHTLNTNKSNYE